MEPKDFVTRYEAALATQDWTQVAPLISDEAVVIFSNGAIHVGKAAIRTAYQRNFSTIKSEVYRVENLRWLIETTQCAAYMFDFAWSGLIDERMASGAGRGTAVLRRDGDAWLLVGEQLGSKTKRFT